MNVLPVKIVDSPEDAPDYKKQPSIKGATLHSAVIIKKGTDGGNSTVDLRFEMQDGTFCVAMTTGNILMGLAGAIQSTIQS